MKNQFYRINFPMLAAVLTLGLIVLSPARTEDAVAGGCTSAYLSSIDAAGDHPDSERRMYYLECAARYLGCMRGRILDV